MRELTVRLGDRSYPIHIGHGALTQTTLWRQLELGRKATIVTNTTVAPLYLATLQQVLQAAGTDTVYPVILPDGEAFKDSATLGLIYDALLGNRCERGTPVIALGGGVIGDMTGFAAATYQRGVPFVQVPTTLLSQVDSSVGGKTAINHPLGKNMIGAFYQPKAVFADTASLDTLPDRELKAGLAEVIKYGAIRDMDFLVWLESTMPSLLRRDAGSLEEAVARSCANKAEIVSADEREAGVRAYLNLGHTFGHAIETGMGYGAWLHGEAVAAGSAMAAELSQRMGWLTAEDNQRLLSLLAAAGLPLRGPVMPVDRYLELMGHDKKVDAGRIRYVLLRGLGQAALESDVPEALVRETLAACMECPA